MLFERKKKFSLVYETLHPLKGRITYFFIYFKIIYYFFASSTWYKVFHIKTQTKQ